MLGILNRGGHDFDPVDLLGVPRYRQRNRPDPAVGVNHRLTTIQPCIVNRRLVQPLCLLRIDLVERQRRNCKVNAEQLVVDFVLAPQRLIGIAQQLICPLIVNVLHNALYFRHSGHDPSDNLLFHRQPLRVRDQNDHHFMAIIAPAHHHRSDDALASPLVIRRHVVLPQEVPNDDNRLVNFRILNIEVFNRHQGVAPPLIKAGFQLAPDQLDGHLGLIPVVVRFFHPHRRRHLNFIQVGLLQ